MEPKDWRRINRALFDVEMSTMVLRVAIDRVNRKNNIPPKDDPATIDAQEKTLMVDDGEWDGLFSDFEAPADSEAVPPSDNDFEAEAEPPTPSPAAPSAQDDANGGFAMPFGRYEGKTIAELYATDKGYLAWMANNNGDGRSKETIERIRKFLEVVGCAKK